MRDHEGDGQDYYYLLQELYSVSGLATSNGLRAEHAVYDAYGQVTLYAWPSADVTSDGQVNIFDLVAVRGALNTISPLHDVNLDGAVNIFDLVTVRGQLDTSAVATTTSNVGNPYYFTGRLTDTLHASDLLVANDPHFHRLQDNRNRTYDAKHGRWLQRDPLGVRPETPGGSIVPATQYRDGMNTFEYLRSRPTTGVDPTGKYCGAWRMIPGTGVELRYKHWLVTGTAVVRDPGRVFRREYNVEMEVDYELLTLTRNEIRILVVAGEKSTTALTIPWDTLGWRLPSADQLVPGAVDRSTFAQLTSLEGVGCRKLEVCVRPCTRCCATTVPFGNTRTYNQIGCVFGKPPKAAQYRYGRIKTGFSGGMSCELFPANKLIRDNKGNYYGPQPSQLACSEAAVPRCDKGDVERCYPSDWDWDGKPDARGIWPR